LTGEEGKGDDDCWNLELEWVGISCWSPEVI
jgi:hypothetical protein